MASRPSVASPTPDVGFSLIKTPTGDDKVATTTAPSTTWTALRIPLAKLAQLLIFCSIFVYVFGQFFYFSKGYKETLVTRFGKWYDVPEDDDEDGGHEEMILPTYFFLFTIIPVAAAVLLFEFLRGFNVRQISSRFVLHIARVLRRKPRISCLPSLSLGEWLFLIVLIGGNIYVFVYYIRIRYQKNKARGRPMDLYNILKMIALTFGFISIFNLSFLFLPATRNCVWMEFLNISYANGVKYHRWIAVVTIGAALLHCILYYWAWIIKGEWVEEAMPCFHCDAGDDGKDPWMNFLGLIALIAFLLVGATSIPYVRRKLYNVFYFVHQFFIIGVVFAVLHWNSVIMWILPTFVLYLISRSLSSSNGFTPVAVKEFTTLGDDIVKITLSRSTSQAGDYKVGQFVYINVPSISKLEWHAFTVASSPRSNATSVTLLFKSLGDWTHELVKYTNECKKNNVLPIVYMDAFYGASLELYEEYSTVCLVGGGIGATPMIAILEDMVEKLSRGIGMTQKVYFVFTFRELALLEEIHPLLVRIKELDPQQQYFTFDFHLTRTPTDEQLDSVIDHDRLGGKPHVLATTYDKTVDKKTPVPFSAPLRSQTSKALMYFVVFFVVCLVLTIVKYGKKVQASHDNLWPLQNFVEISLVLVTVIVIVASFVVFERKFRGHAQSPSEAISLQQEQPSGVVTFSTDVHSFRDLVFESGVAVGARPDMAATLDAVLQGHKQFQATHPSVARGPVGVFISGPESLKDATVRAVADLGAVHFDIHEEQFEL